MQKPERTLEHVVVGDVHVLRLLTTKLDDETTLLVLEDELGDIIEQCQDVPPKVVLNFASVQYIFTAALAKLVSYRRMLVDRGGKIGLCCLHDAVREVVCLMRFDELFPISETEADALARLQQAV
jgi:anti-anti-sigma factor